jgi:hypothetical protein
VQPEEVLGLRPGASPQACRTAYRRLVRVHHPDAHPDAAPAERAAHAVALRQVMEAWAALGGSEEVVAPAASGPGVVGHQADESLGCDDDLGTDPDTPLTSAGSGRVPVMIAMFLVAAAFVSFCVSVVMSQTVLWQLSLGLGFAALLAFVLLPFFVMLRGHR